jgi:hypothetical protein
MANGAIERFDAQGVRYFVTQSERGTCRQKANANSNQSTLEEPV